MKTTVNLSFFLIAFLFIACSGGKTNKEIGISYDSFPRKIDIPDPTSEQQKTFNRDITGIEKTVTKENGKTYHGYTTTNREFYEKVMKPILLQYINELKKMNKVELINTLTLFGHEIFRKYFGYDFYRWAGDINDLDDPQDKLAGYQYRYGLDCSGFATLPYSIAVDLGLLDYTSDAAVLSSKGFEYYCKKNNIKDIGGNDNTSNNYRLDTREMYSLGREIISVPKGGSPTDEQLKLLQAGDFVGRPGHVGIIVMINNQPYYLESGGWAVPKNGGFPCRAKEALEIFAKRGNIMVRRILPDETK